MTAYAKLTTTAAPYKALCAVLALIQPYHPDTLRRHATYAALFDQLRANLPRRDVRGPALNVECSAFLVEEEQQRYRGSMRIEKVTDIFIDDINVTRWVYISELLGKTLLHVGHYGERRTFTTDSWGLLGAASTVTALFFEARRIAARAVVRGKISAVGGAR